MQQYLDLVDDTLSTGTYKPNRTGVDTVASFSGQYTVDLSEGFPLLTTKRMDGYRWNSLIHEVLWYLSGEEHVRNLREETKIWDAWADEAGRLDTAYGRFWRRYPVPDDAAGLPGETWPEDAHRWVTVEEDADGHERRTFDQIGYVLDTLAENPRSRRMVVSAWHPANAATSTLPPCHYTFVVNVQDGRLNLHLTQRSGDIALGVPFNIAAYALLANALAQQSGFEVGEFGHTVVDAHVYCGRGDRGAWYAQHLSELQERLADVDDRAGYLSIKEWLEGEAPAEADGEAGYDHVPGLLEQLSREPRPRPRIEIADKPLDELTYEDVAIVDYDCADGLTFAVAE
ncbi:thymidylate synthase [Halorubrum sp. JWXQ-INN 858]|uniref:thymidylate synthase n=1 Tax=Halorubrum sp. JWXQ-INN 858 TaxID=2690782 RepID=UPI00135B692A|nr:thymidylate synthase [Halorubrum sp. JWXQ-INN 858]MWV64693.1 thymidylate synthase [Halorubrum sp. JWXQ-INN 858]